MSSTQTKTPRTSGHPSGDERYKAIDLTMKRFKYQKDVLLEVLNTAQETFGYLSEDLLIYVSQQLDVPLVKAYGVATFYHMFTFSPLGDHNTIICTGTACHVKGADKIVNTIAEAYYIEPGETTSDGLLSLTIARCIGSCGLAPVAVFDGKVMGKETAEGMLAHINEIIAASREKLPEGSGA